MYYHEAFREGERVKEGRVKVIVSCVAESNKLRVKQNVIIIQTFVDH